MDLFYLLNSGHSKPVTSRIVDYVGDNKTRFAQLVKIFRAGPAHIRQRAAWPLSYCVQNHPGLLTPHFKAVLDVAAQPGNHVAVRRNTMRMLQYADLPDSHAGRVADLCFMFLGNNKEPVATRVFAMNVSARLAAAYPDLKNELLALIEQHLPGGSPAFKSAAKKVTRKLSVR